MLPGTTTGDHQPCCSRSEGVLVSVDSTSETMTAFLKDLSDRGPFGRHLAADVTFTTVSTGRVIAGRQAVEQFIRNLHERAFNAHMRVKAALIHGSQAALEVDFVGLHTGEFMGVAATGREIDVPCSMICDLRDGVITALRGHLPLDLLLLQIGAPPPEGAE
jgi:hypothetical protein